MPDYVLFGTDTIYKLAVHTGVIRPFLASGVKGSTSYNSLPIDILCVREETSRGDNNAEFIACFTGMVSINMYFCRGTIFALICCKCFLLK